MKLTKKQKQVYDFICDYISNNCVSPTQIEIQEHFNFKSLGSVQDYIRYLTNAGYLKTNPHTVRGLEPTTPDDPALNLLEIPLMGKVAAGAPIEAIDSSTPLTIPASMVKRNHQHFALEVCGNSMIEDGIFEGDVLVVQEQQTAEQGQTVVALIDNEATVKRYYKKSGQIELHPANSTMSPIIVNQGDFKIAGIVAALLRQY